MEGWMDEWMDGWMDGWMDVLHGYVRVLSLWNFGFGDISLFNFI